MATRHGMATDATLLDLTSPSKKRVEYVRSVVENFYKLGPKHFDYALRIGVQGTGRSPHYKFEGHDGTVKIYNGMSHGELSAFEISDIRENHWSSQTMGFAEVASHLGDLRSKTTSKA